MKFETLPAFVKHFIDDSSNQNKFLLTQLFFEAAAAINVHPDKLPPPVPPEKAAQILNVADATLSIWRCTGRQNLRYFKVSRLVNYRMVDLIEFKAKRIHGHTGEAA